MNRIEPVGAAGRRATQGGRDAKEEIASLLTAAGYDFERRVAVGEGIYGRVKYVDFLVAPTKDWPNGLILEVRSQTTSGTADEKLPYVVENIRHCYPAPTVILLAGGGFSEGAISWLHRQVDGRSIIAVLTSQQIAGWVRRAMAS